MARRTGLRTLRNLAHQFCRVFVAFSPILNAVYGSNAGVTLALAAANTACGNLVQEADNVLETGD